MNLELYFDGIEHDRDKLFEPRRAPMTARQTGDATVELHQPPTPEWGVESWTTFTLTPPHYIDFHYRALLHKDTFRDGFFGVFWASYIDHPEDIAISFPAMIDREQRWVRHYSPVHGIESTHRHHADPCEIEPTGQQTVLLYGSYSPWKYTRPMYLGVSHGMSYVFMTEDNPHVRLTQSPSGGGPGSPAWDWQLVAPGTASGDEHTLSARVAYTPWRGIQDAEEEYDAWLRDLESPEQG